jgi:F-type H+-transporting ATPase subunit epsilon
VTIVTPHGTRAEYNVRHLRAPGGDGDFGVLYGHLPFMTTLKMGALILDTDNGRKIWAISGGFAEVLDDHVSILAETAEAAETIDLARAESARQRALTRIQQHEHEIDYARAKSALARAMNRIHVASGAADKDR